MPLPWGLRIAGAIFLILTALGFEFESPWVFIAGVVLLLAWLGAVLNGAGARSGDEQH